jgi:hypothetical protein
VVRAWLEGMDLTPAIETLQIGDYYKTVSWHCLLAGYGTFPDRGYRPPQGPHETHFQVADFADFTERCALNFRPHAEQLARLQQASA